MEYEAHCQVICFPTNTPEWMIPGEEPVALDLERNYPVLGGEAILDMWRRRFAK